MRKTAAAQAAPQAVLKEGLRQVRRLLQGAEQELLPRGRFLLPKSIFKLEFDPVGAIAVRAIAPG